MNELQLNRYIAWGLLALGAVVFLSLFFVVAPYGRHTRRGWGPTIPTWLGWVLMEGLGVTAFSLFFALGQHAREVVPLCLAALWVAHYLNRSFIYPLRMRGGDRPMPAAIALMAIVFNVLNAFVNGRWVGELGEYNQTWLFDPRFLGGVALFIAGMVINIQSDNVLRALRKPGESGYSIPQGGLYRWVTSPNYFGELLEWGGWALATWSLAGLSFFLFTCANLVPRAIAHRRWYRATFPEYPAERRALVPFVL